MTHCTCPKRSNEQGVVERVGLDMRCSIHGDPSMRPRHLIHCNASDSTPIGKGICICLHELRATMPDTHKAACQSLAEAAGDRK